MKNLKEKAEKALEEIGIIKENPKFKEILDIILYFSSLSKSIGKRSGELGMEDWHNLYRE